MRQQQRLRYLRLLRDQSAAVAVRRGDEASGHVVAEEREVRGVAAIAHRQRAGGGAVLRVGERRLRAEGDVRQIDAMPGEGLRVANLDAAAVDDPPDR